jgi:hypothetical protein
MYMASFKDHQILSCSPGVNICSEHSTSGVNITTGQYGFQEACQIMNNIERNQKWLKGVLLYTADPRDFLMEISLVQFAERMMHIPSSHRLIKR